MFYNIDHRWELIFIPNPLIFCYILMQQSTTANKVFSIGPFACLCCSFSTRVFSFSRPPHPLISFWTCWVPASRMFTRPRNRSLTISFLSWTRRSHIGLMAPLMTKISICGRHLCVVKFTTAFTASCRLLRSPFIRISRREKRLPE